MPIDPGLIGSVLNALPIDKMIAAPLNAMITAQIQASKAYADFLLSVCIKDGKAIAIQFDYQETMNDSEGNTTGVLDKTMRIPLLAAITHPNICIEEGSIDFELTVSQSMEEHSSTSAEGGFEAKIGWGPFSVSMHGSVSHKTEQTRKTDTRAKYSVHVSAKRQGPTEAMSRVIDFLTDAATKPTVLPGNKEPKKPDQLTNEVSGPDAKPAAAGAGG